MIVVESEGLALGPVRVRSVYPTRVVALLWLAVAAVVAAGCGVGPPTAPSTPAAGSPSPAMTDPYWGLPSVPGFRVSSDDLSDGQPMPVAQMSGLNGVPGGNDRSPALQWSGYPADTKSFAVTMYDVDAPTGSGFWHWVVADLPPSAASLRSGAGVPESTLLPEGAVQFSNDAGLHRYLGAAPPAGASSHHYYLTVTALDVARVDVPPAASPALVGFTVAGHTLGRGHLMATARR